MVLSVLGVWAGTVRTGATGGGARGVSCFFPTTGFLCPTGVGTKLSPLLSASFACRASCSPSFLLYSAEPSPPALPLMASVRAVVRLAVADGFSGANRRKDAKVTTAASASPNRQNTMKRRFFSVLVMSLMKRPHLECFSRSV